MLVARMLRKRFSTRLCAVEPVATLPLPLEVLGCAMGENRELMTRRLGNNVLIVMLACVGRPSIDVLMDTTRELLVIVLEMVISFASTAWIKMLHHLSMVTFMKTSEVWNVSLVAERAILQGRMLIW